MVYCELSIKLIETPHSLVKMHAYILYLLMLWPFYIAMDECEDVKQY